MIVTIAVDTIRKQKDLPKKCFLVFFNQSKKKWRVKYALYQY